MGTTTTSDRYTLPDHLTAALFVKMTEAVDSDLRDAAEAEQAGEPAVPRSSIAAAVINDYLSAADLLVRTLRENNGHHELTAPDGERSSAIWTKDGRLILVSKG